MSVNKKEEKVNELKSEFEKIQEVNKGLDISLYIANKEDMPDLGDIQMYDYDSDLTSSLESSMEVLESLVDLYLGDSPELVNHKYIRTKMKEDAIVYAETVFLSKMTRKNFLTQLRQVDNGDHNARMHEVINQTVREIRENAKFSSTQRTELEKFYQGIRSDLGLGNLADKNTVVDQTPSDDSGNGMVIDSKDLNDQIDDILRKKKL